MSVILFALAIGLRVVKYVVLAIVAVNLAGAAMLIADFLLWTRRVEEADNG